MTTDAESILVIAEHPHIATLWVQLNAEALQHAEKEVRIVVYTEHVTRSDRLIVIGNPKRKVVERARSFVSTQAIKMQHSDRLAAGWRTA